MDPEDMLSILDEATLPELENIQQNVYWKAIQLSKHASEGCFRQLFLRVYLLDYGLKIFFVKNIFQDSKKYRRTNTFQSLLILLAGCSSGFYFEINVICL